MGRQNTVGTQSGRTWRLVTPVLGLSALALAGCVQTGSADLQVETVSRPTGSVALTPSHGGVQGGNLVLVDTGVSPDGPVTAAFGDAAAVECAFDEASARHACLAPEHDVPGTVDVALSVDGTRIAETASYTYTTNGTQDMPILTVETQNVRKHAEEIRAGFPEDVQLGAVLKNGEPVDVFGKVINDAAQPEYFFVPKLDDAIALREAGIESKIAILYVSQIEDIPLMLHYDIEVAATDPAWVAAAEEIVAGTGGTLRVHLWVDTGMGREGVTPDQALPLARAVEEAKHLELTGIATHFSSVTEHDAAAIQVGDTTNTTVAQKTRFDGAVAQIRDAGLGQDALIHAGASDVLLNELDPLYYDLMRIGGMFFGGSAENRVYSWTMKLQQVKTLPAGWCIDYGCTEPTQAPKKVGVITHVPGRETQVVFSVGGQEVPVLLNHRNVITLDLSNVPDAVVGDEVVIDFNPDSFYMLDASLPLPVTTSGG
ncbi:hypothetical protein GCM10010977_27550 [Citricoccus zhacaiensis]|uniref:Alanine racemase N-terminal domain-containing protein n=1 Tax=Citricoccus zhacaiensis TaxID=489142 RepID=A0ABQ2M8Y7_9MICC|nr:alanine racemase [Citricoccus zhacaiensis]GGO48293.1 hypothetical protein GCM10010977_27550 [Citricoccus zhacaiensis]